MKQYLSIEPWRVVEGQYFPDYNEASESVMSIGNGKMGQRANFEEYFSGKSLSGNYLAGIYYPDKTRVGWWKNGYPEYFAKVLNAVNWIGLNIIVNEQILDLNVVKIHRFERVLDMKRGVLERKFVVEFPKGEMIEVETFRFYSMVQDEIGVLDYKIKALNFSGKIQVESILDFNVRNRDANYDEVFWTPIKESVHQNNALVIAETKKTAFRVACAVNSIFIANKTDVSNQANWEQAPQKISRVLPMAIQEG
ncbi:MAG TPA: glycoside hydrolase family 65 protein, partial [Saprospiraceae bacterium]|nr:glycoside hydrolase family 65 protein [Saprospiraceae bacterium]